ncbi:MAG: PEGA domain protein [Methanoregula sp. PtaU1.Bin051]|nr:MAG: PEGA domain protein [Methanoregula sp. PtaU1.Bin051]
MYKHLYRILPALLLLILLCGSAQATDLQVTVQDVLDNTTIPQATVYLDNVNIGRTTSSGTILITHSGIADLDLRVTKVGYEDWEDTVGMNVTSLLVNMTRKTLVLKVQLYDSDSFEMIPNAEVKLTTNNATDIKKTDSNGLVSYAVTANTVYDIAISAPSYQSQVLNSIEIGTENKAVQYWLMRSDRFSIIVTDKDNNPVQDAAVYIDSEVRGKTDARGFLILQIDRGNPYVIEVKKDGYQSFVERKTISVDEALLTVQISKVPIGAFISVYDENRLPVEGAAVYLDNAVAGYTDKYGKYTMGTITSGSYQLEVRKPGYATQKETITISKQGDEFTIDLPYEEVNLTIFVQDKDQKVIPGALVYVNGKDLGLSSENGEVSTLVKYNAVNNITVQKDGYQSVSVRNSVIIGNTTSSTTIILERNIDWGFIGLIVIGAIGVLLVFAIIRHISNKPGRHVVRRNEI